ncbi:MAG: SIMPL domain-containing protein [Deltaproteobacteria bacterium]|nr:SIMPL domain-containing protein [Deltaproteobacteria bacterium]
MNMSVATEKPELVARPTLPRDLRPLGIIAIAIGLVASTWIAASSWKQVRMKPVVRKIDVTGSAKKRITSDLIQWSASVEATAPDRTAAYKSLHEQVEKAVAYLKAQGVKPDEIRPSSVTFQQLYDTVYEGTGKDRIAKQVPAGYSTTQSIEIHSTDVTLVERVSREISQLLDQGVSVTSNPPSYFYTKLGELKIQMLAEAAKDARTRADNIIKQSGGATVGQLKSADMGVINVNAADVTATSWEGNNDTTSLDKDIITIVHASFELE